MIIDVEADPRHAEIILQEMDMERCTGSDVLGRAVKGDEIDVELGPQEARHLRSVAARRKFLAAG